MPQINYTIGKSPSRIRLVARLVREDLRKARVAVSHRVEGSRKVEGNDRVVHRLRVKNPLDSRAAGKLRVDSFSSRTK